VTNNIDELDGLELWAEFARALGHEATITLEYNKRGVSVRAKGNNMPVGYWTELPADVILQEFNRIKPLVKWGAEQNCYMSIWNNRERIKISSSGPNLETAVARLVVKMGEEIRGLPK
jgi:hypothetical protein